MTRLFPLKQKTLEWDTRESAFLPAASWLKRTQEVAEGEVGHALPVIPRHFVRSAEVDSLVDADVDHIVRHV
jgi:hypothetical protein